MQDVLGALGRMGVSLFPRTTWCCAQGGLGAELSLSSPQVPLKVFAQLLLPLQLWVVWQVPGQVLVLLLLLLLLVQVPIPQTVPVPVPFSPQEE